MKLKFLLLSLILLSVILVLPSTSNAYSSLTLGPGPTTYVIATGAYPPWTVDSAMAYDAVAQELIANIYDTLVAFKGSDPSNVVPWLAESYSVSPDGLTYQFRIRPDVPWQNVSYGFVTPEDVEYSLERVLVRDYYGGPAWMFWYPIFGQYAANLTDPVAQGIAIDNAISSNATAVVIHFSTGKAYQPFLGILARPSGSVLSKQWCIDNGDWNPAVDSLADGTWVNAHDPASSPLDTPTYKMMGSGPYKFDYLNPSASWSIVRNPGFWGGWGNSRGSLLGITTPLLGYLDRITWYFVSGYSTRLAGFTGTDPIYDSITIPRKNMSSVWQQPNIKSLYPFPASVIDGLFFSYSVPMSSFAIGTPTNATYFGPDGIRPDFFSDVHARRAIAYSLNWSAFFEEAYYGEAQQPTLPVPIWDAFYNNSLTGYSFNKAKAIEEWKMAWGGTLESPGPVWTYGFRFSMFYGWTLIPRGTVALLLKAALESENPLFHLDIESYPGAYVNLWQGAPGGRSDLPIYQVGWLGDYPDADDWVTPFLQSSGTFSYPQHIEMDPYSPLMDNLIEWGRHNATFEGRNANYQRLWQLYLQQVPSVPLEETTDRLWARDWVHGWYYNPVNPGVYGYTVWKQELPREDVNSDGKVDIKDLAIAAKVFGAYYIQPLLAPYPSGPAGYHTPSWNCKADVNIVNTATGARSDMKIDIRDLAAIAKLYGYVAPEWQPPP